MMREFTCIICPNGCEIQVRLEEDIRTEGEPLGKEQGKSPAVCSITGAACPRGEEYVRQELTDPRRNIATSVLVEGGELPLASVRLTSPIPKGMIFKAMEEIKKVHLKAPVQAGTVVIHQLLGQEADVIVTRDVKRAGSFY